MNRRKFIRKAAVGAAGIGVLNNGALIKAGDQLQQARGARSVVAPSDRMRLGIIGPGSRGQELMRQMLRVPGAEIVALCDVYEPRIAQARKLTKAETPAYRDYRQLLDRKDLDAVLVATPLSFHEQHVIAALESGRHVLGEKSLAYSVAGCDRIVETIRRTGKLFQVGHQYRYAPWTHESLRRIAKGEIGKVTHIFGYWHRNNNWRCPVPANASRQLEHLINWRLYKEYSGGLMAELGSHQIDLANWVFGSAPESVVGSGNIAIYRDGRETNDNVQAIFEYPGGRKLVFSSLLNNHKVGYQLWIAGTDGNCEITLEDATFYYEPKRAGSAVTGEIVERGVTTGATYSTKGDMPYRGEGAQVVIPTQSQGDPTHISCREFIDSVRRNKRPLADEIIGYNSAVSVALANKAIDDGRRVMFADHAKIENMKLTKAD